MKRYRRTMFLIAVLAIAFVMLLTACSGSKPDIGDISNIPADIIEETPKVAMDVPDLAEYVQQRTVTLDVTLSDGSSTGSGFFIDDQGTIVTSYHVIDGATDIQVQVNGGAKYALQEIVDFNEPMDLAVVKIDITGNDYLIIPEQSVRTGENVYAVGSSLGFLDGTFSNGIVSTASRKVGQIPCIQTTAAISSGNSGGPLVNQYGEVVGVNAFSYTDGENLNLAVKIDTLDTMSMDKHWDLSKYREWFDKEVSRSFLFYDYIVGEYVESKVNTYQHVTGAECIGSTLAWDFLEGNYDYVVDGYDTMYGIFFYEYNASEFDNYTEYLSSVGFEYDGQEKFTEGVSYYYYNTFTGMQIDLFVMSGDELLVVEPYCNAE